MSEQHTSGPWTFVPASTSGACSSGDDNDMGGFKGPDGEFVCHFGDDTMYYPSAGTPPKDADARLIASAPKLLATAVELLRILEVPEVAWPALGAGYGKARDDARQAIAEATGGVA